MFTDDVFRLGRYLAQGLRHLDLGAGDGIRGNNLALGDGTDQAHHFLRHSESGCAVELFFDFAGNLDGERKGGRAAHHSVPWPCDLILHWSDRHEDRAEPTNVANAGWRCGLWKTPTECLPHNGLHMLWLKTLAGTHDTDLEGSLELDFLRPQPLVFELSNERAL